MTDTNKWVIFDLDGTLADIDIRRKLATKSNGKIDWDIFFSPKLVSEDEPNIPVIKMAQTLAEAGYMIAIFSGRSKSTDKTTRAWLSKHRVPFHLLKMRPTEHPFKYMPDEKLKSDWFDELFPGGVDVMCVFDDRNKVVDMWRSKNITCMQVAPGDF